MKRRPTLPNVGIAVALALCTQMVHAEDIDPPELSIATAVELTWPSEADQEYRLYRSVGDLEHFVPLGDPIAGTGSDIQLFDSTKGTQQAFYKLEADPQTPTEPEYKFDGTWVGRTEGGASWIITYSPDASGRNATFTEEWITNGHFDYLALDPVGATKVSVASGYVRMTGTNTAVTKTMWYLVGPSPVPEDGSLPPNGLEEIKAIAVLEGEVTFSDLNTIEGLYDLKIYNTLIDPVTGERDLSMVPTEAMGDPYVEYLGIPAVNERIL